MVHGELNHIIVASHHMFTPTNRLTWVNVGGGWLHSGIRALFTPWTGWAVCWSCIHVGCICVPYACDICACCVCMVVMTIAIVFPCESQWC